MASIRDMFAADCRRYVEEKIPVYFSPEGKGPFDKFYMLETD